MGTATNIQSFSLTMNRSFNATKQAVYDAWINADSIKSWFAPTNEMETIVHTLEPKVGGKYRIEMLEPDGTSHIMHGEYLELKPHDQLVFTWEWESDTQHVNSLVTIDLTEDGANTNMVLTHEKLASQESVDLHMHGWTGCIAQLELFFK